jgi:hypothetical protein
VLQVTLHNDPDSLEAVLDWGRGRGLANKWGPGAARAFEKNPIVLSCLEGYTLCTERLFRAGYRVALHPEDRRRVEGALQWALPVASQIQVLRAESMAGNQRTQQNHRWASRIHKRVDIKTSDDPVERFLLFKAFASPHYLSVAFTEANMTINELKMSDPLRKAFVLSQYSKFLSDYFPEHMEEYTEIREGCEKFARDILEQCNSTEDVRVLMEHRSREGGDEAAEDTTWHIALWEEHKQFVAHPYYQHLTGRRMWGENFNPHRYFLFWRLIMFPISVLLFFAYPGVVLIDGLFLKADLIFVSPNMKKRMIDVEDMTDERQERENCFWAFFRERLHRPIYRIFICFFWEVVVLGILFRCLTKRNDAQVNFTWEDYTISICIGHFLLEDVLDIVRRKWTYLSSFWGLYSLATNIVLTAGSLVAYHGLNKAESDFRANVSGNHPLNIGMTLIAYGATMAVLRLVRWFLLNRNIGPVVVCVIRILKDVFYVFGVFLVIYLSFAFGMWFMYKPFTKMGGSNQSEGNCTTMFCLKEEMIYQNPGMRGILSLMFWRVFDGDASTAMVQSKEEFNNGTMVFSVQFSHIMGLTMWAMYQGLTAILLINILIALMNSTYIKVWKNVDVEWKFSKTFYQEQYLAPRAIFPPPFRWIYYFAKFARYCKERRGRAEDVTGSDGRDDYFQLLQRLIRTKMQSEVETTIQEDFKDLRIDLKNIMEGEMKKEISKLQKVIDEKDQEIARLGEATK